MLRSRWVARLKKVSFWYIYVRKLRLYISSSGTDELISPSSCLLIDMDFLSSSTANFDCVDLIFKSFGVLEGVDS